MIKYLFQLVFLATWTVLSGQNYEKLIVTEINHSIILNQSYGVRENSFPCYFNDTLFLHDLRDTLLTYAKKKYGIKEVSMPSTSRCAETLLFKKIKPVVPYNSESSALYMTISTGLSFHSLVFQEIYYQLITYVNIVDYKTKKKLKRTLKTPFMIKTSNGIVTDTLIHQTDFEIFYLDAIAHAFQDGPSVLEKRYIFQPLTQQYDEILALASEYVTGRTDTTYYLNRNFSESITVLGIHQYPEDEIPDSLWGLFSHLTQYQISHKHTPDSNDILFGVNDSNEVDITISKGYHTGSLKYDYNNNLVGIINKDSVSVLWNNATSVAEIYVNGELLGMLHDQEDGLHLYFKPANSPTALAELAFIVFIYEESGYVLQEALEPEPVYIIADPIDLLF